MEDSLLKEARESYERSKHHRPNEVFPISPIEHIVTKGTRVYLSVDKHVDFAGEGKNIHAFGKEILIIRDAAGTFMGEFNRDIIAGWSVIDEAKDSPPSILKGCTLTKEGLSTECPVCRTIYDPLTLNGCPICTDIKEKGHSYGAVSSPAVVGIKII